MRQCWGPGAGNAKCYLSGIVGSPAWHCVIGDEPGARGAQHQRQKAPSCSWVTVRQRSSALIAEGWWLSWTFVLHEKQPTHTDLGSRGKPGTKWRGEQMRIRNFWLAGGNGFFEEGPKLKETQPALSCFLLSNLLLATEVWANVITLFSPPCTKLSYLVDSKMNDEQSQETRNLS